MSSSPTITTAFQQQFHDTFIHALQSRESFFGKTVVNRGMIEGSSFTVNNIGSSAMREVTGRYQDKSAQDIAHSTRIAYMADYDAGPYPVDSFDLPKLVADPTYKYVELLQAAAERQKDIIIYRALLDGSLTRSAEGGSVTTTTLPAGQQIASGGTGLSKAKVIQAKSLFRKNKADGRYEPGTKLYIAYNSDSVRQILSDTTLTSADYMASKFLEQGEVGNWCGFEWIPYEELDSPAANTLRTVAWSSTAVHYGTGIGVKTDIGENKSKRGNPMEVYGVMSLGATRQDEKKVVQIDFATNV
ncbi:phage capsid protein [Roseateles sp. PN1]|uniref:phage capsid protein n=1 Tax=Roseateles sp. PN1 TaxID=3137372 RepID=UPI003139F461